MAMKALLRGIGQPGWGHDLVKRGNAVRELFGPGLVPVELDEALKRLSVHYVASRYPDTFAEGTPADHYSVGIAGSALADAEEVLDTVATVWNVLVAGSDGARGRPQAVLARRAHERSERIDQARRYAAGLSTSLGVRSVVVFGSVARGDFNVWSDLDVLVIAENLPEDWFERHQLLLAQAAEPVSVVAWTPSEWTAKVAKRDPIAAEVAEVGVTVAGRVTTWPPISAAPMP